MWDTICTIFHWLGIIIYDPYDYLYCLLPWHESITQWKNDFIFDYLQKYIGPIILDIGYTAIVEYYLGPAAGTFFDIGSHIVAFYHFFHNLGEGLIYLFLGIVKTPIVLILALGPLIGPIILDYYLLKWFLRFIRAMLLKAIYKREQAKNTIQNNEKDP